MPSVRRRVEWWLHNCSPSVALEVDDIYVTGIDSAVFGIGEADVEDEPQELIGTLEAGQRRYIEVTYHPQAEQSHGAELIVESDHPAGGVHMACTGRTPLQIGMTAVK